MKIAISATGPDLEADVDRQFGLCRFLIIVDTETMAFEAARGFSVPGRGAGIQLLTLALSKGAEVILTGHISPFIKTRLTGNGIEVRTGVQGKVRDIVEQYREREREETTEDRTTSGPNRRRVDAVSLWSAVRSTARQWAVMLPLLGGIILLTGLLNVFVSKSSLSVVFSGQVLRDTLWGACLGSILAGNPINSYVIGDTLLDNGVSLFAVTAFIFAWVSVGLVQLPAEISALGRRFALLRNALCFIATLPVALVTIILLNAIVRWIR